MTDLLVPAGEAVAEVPSPRRGGGTARYLLTKLGGAIISLFMVVVLGFILFRVMPGDPVKTMTRGHPVTNEQLAILEHRYGLDKPKIAQFWDYLVKLLHGDFGDSYQYSRPVGDMIMEKLWPTVLLVGTGTILAVALGLWLGTRAAWRRNSAFDKASTGIALAFWSMPTFWLGMILLTAAGGVFPSGGMVYADTPPDFFSQALDILHHLVLPVITLVAVVYAQYQLVMRSSLLEEMDADYLTTARAKGLRDDLVRRRHAVPNALLPTVTLVFLHLGMVVAGAITVEAVFSWPGLGQMTYDAIGVPDLPVLQGTFIVLAAAVLVMNFIADVLYRFLDPRVRAV